MKSYTLLSVCPLCKMGDGWRLAAHWWWNSVRVFHPGHPQDRGPGHPSPHCTPVLHSTVQQHPATEVPIKASKMLLLNSSKNTPQHSILTVVKLWSSWICFCKWLRKETIRVPFVVGISFSNNWDTWAGINQCVVVTIWQRTIEDWDQDTRLPRSLSWPVLVMMTRTPGPFTLSLSLALSSRGQHNCLFWNGWGNAFLY